MAGKLQKLKRLKARLQGGVEAAAAVPFELTCECGATVSGMRRKSWIESECPECLQSLFVLTSNVYPSTKSVPSEVLGGSLTDRLKTVAGELFPKKKQTKTKTKPKPAAAETAIAADTQESVSTEPLKPRKTLRQQLDIGRRLKRTFTPFRVLMLAMIGVIGFTSYWMTYQSHVESARQTWLKSPELIEQQLHEFAMVDLERTLQSAVEAADVLERNDVESRRVRNLLQETVAVNKIASRDLLTSFHDAYNKNDVLEDDATETVTDVCRSGTFVFDSSLTKKAGLDDVYLVDFPATPGRHPVEIIVPLPAVAEFLESIGDTRAIFAATIDRVETPKAKTYEPWVLHVEATSFVLLTSLPHCQHIGLSQEDDESLEAIIQRQRDFVEASETWQDRAATAIVEEPEDVEERSGH